MEDFLTLDIFSRCIFFGNRDGYDELVVINKSLRGCPIC